MKRSPLRRAGKRTRAWEAARRRLKVRFAAAGITRCEQCGSDNYLGFAHRRKRRFITTAEELEAVALLCNWCHAAIEGLPESEMSAKIDAIIAAREVAV